MQAAGRTRSDRGRAQFAKASLCGPVEPYIYRPFTNDYGGKMAVNVETGSDPAAMLENVRTALHSVNPAARVYGVRTLAEFVNRSDWQVRWEASLAVTGLLALGLAVAGLYGVISNFVSQRTRDIGVRVAVGARRSDIWGVVLRHGMMHRAAAGDPVEALRHE